MDKIINSVLEILQKTLLNSELTGGIIIPFILMILSIIGVENKNINLQKQSSKCFSVLNYIIFNYRQYSISGYHELLNTIPHLNSILGPIDYDTRMQIQMIEKNKDHARNFKIIGKYQIIIDKIFQVVEKYLNISKNHPLILKTYSIHAFLKDLLYEDKDDSKNTFEILDAKEGGIKKIDFYFDFNDKSNLLKMYFKMDASENFLSEKFPEKTFLDPDDSQDSNGKVSKLISFLYNSKIKGDQKDDQETSQPEILKTKIKEIVFKNKHKIGRQTKIFMGGLGINGCLPILMSLDSEIQNILCQSDVTPENVFVVNVGTPAFCDSIKRQEFISLNYNYYHIISIKDWISFQKNEPWCHLGIPTILCHPSKVNEFFSSFFGQKIKSNIYEAKFSPIDYKEEISQIFTNHFNISEPYNEYQPEEHDDSLLSLPINTNVSFDLDFKYGDNI